MTKDLILDKVSRFNTVSLLDINELQFLNRCDTKFPMPVKKMDELLSILDDDYSLLEIKNQTVFSYKTTYFDTENYNLFIAHQNGKHNRTKLRFREYVDTNDSFLEVKFKTNKGKTLKSRIRYTYNNSFDETARKFLSKSSNLVINDYSPKLITDFSRATLVSFKHKERITLDFNLSFTDIHSGKTSDVPYLAIAELKNEGFGNKSNFYSFMQKIKVKPSGMSKYCTGVSLLNENIKRNAFKERMLWLNKLNTLYLLDNNLYTLDGNF